MTGLSDYIIILYYIILYYIILYYIILYYIKLYLLTQILTFKPQCWQGGVCWQNIFYHVAAFVILL